MSFEIDSQIKIWSFTIFSVGIDTCARTYAWTCISSENQVFTVWHKIFQRTSSFTSPTQIEGPREATGTYIHSAQKWKWPTPFKSRVLKASTIKCLLKPWSTLNQPLINLQSTPDQHLGWQSVKRQLIFADTPLSVDQYIRVGQHYQPEVNQMLIERQSSVNRVSVEMPIECRSRCRSSFYCRSIEGINPHSTVDAFGTHNPTLQYIWYKSFQKILIL